MINNNSFYFSLVTQSCLTLCDPMDCSTPGLSNTSSWSLLKLLAIESVMTSNHLILCRRPSLLLPSIFSSISIIFQWVSSSHQLIQVLEFQLQHQSFQWVFSFYLLNIKYWASQVVLVVKNLRDNTGEIRHKGSMEGVGEGREERPWKIPSTEEPGSLAT